MRAFKLLIACLSTLIAFNLSAKPKDEKTVTYELLQEGHKIQQSTVDDLLIAIEKGTYLHSDDPNLPYANLGRFSPFTNDSSLKVLNLIQKTITDKTSFVRIDRLLTYMINDYLRPRVFAENLYNIMNQLPTGEAKRVAAVILT